MNDYQVQISTDPNFVTIAHLGSPAGTGYTVPDVDALPDGVYYWRVRPDDQKQVGPLIVRHREIRARS